MSTNTSTGNTTGKTPKAQQRSRLPDPPEREPDDMTSLDRLAENGNVYHHGRSGGSSPPSPAVRRQSIRPGLHGPGLFAFPVRS